MPPVLLDVDSLPHLGAGLDPATDPAAALAQTHAIGGTATILKELELVWSVALDRRTVALIGRVRGLSVWKGTITVDGSSISWHGQFGLFKLDVTLAVDFELGELTITGDVCVLELSWKCYRYPTEVLVAWSPTLGSVGGSLLAHPPQVDDGSAGPSHSVVPTITRIPVDLQHRIGTPVGSMVKSALFAAFPDFVFNVCFAVGPFKLFRPGAYGDPTSPWWNVFAGYYQIDCPTPAWDRPFGYTLTADGPQICFDDLIRIGKADWNYFSNWMYGVPLADVTPFDALDPGVVCTASPRVTIGQSQWDIADIDGFSTVSAYQADGSTALVDNTALTPLWRVTYGEPASVAGHPTSFVGAMMHARLYMAYTQDASGFHTYLFGGTVNKAFDATGNPGFLTRQMAACANVIATHYPTLGFPLT